jgi:hypothetical protein
MMMEAGKMKQKKNGKFGVMRRVTVKINVDKKKTNG